MNLRRRLFYTITLLVFFLSGSAALVYQIVWQRVLTMYYGVGAVSVAVIVAVFMAGLGVGNVLGGWLSERTERRLALYVGCELAIAAFGAISLPLFGIALPMLSRLGYFGGFVLIGAQLLIPTTLMGMTLPVMIKLVNGAVRDVGRNVSLLYFANTIGAAAGAFGASYWLISFYGLDGATAGAVAINLLLCVLTPLVWLAWPAGTPAATEAAVTADEWSRERVLMFGSGALAIGYQLIWFRVLSTLLKPNSYVFSTVLGVYLCGLALGSLWMSRRIRSLQTGDSRRRTFYWLNAGIAIVMLMTFAGFDLGMRVDAFASLVRAAFGNELHPPYRSLLEFPGATPGERVKNVMLAWDSVLWSAGLVLPATLLMGASYPLLTATAIGRSAKDGLRAGVIASIAIAGNVTGALVTGFVLLPRLGTERTLLLFVCAGALWLLGITEWRGRPLPLRARGIAATAVVLVAIIMLPGRTDLYAALHPPPDGRHRVITEGIDGTAVTFRSTADGADVIQVYIGGSSHATFPSPAYQTEVLEAATYAASVRNVLVIGFGGGDLTAHILQIPGVERVTIVEISEALTANIRQIPAYQQLLSDPRVHYVVDDGRRFLQRSGERFDLLLMDPLQSTAAYSNNLYSLEFFDLVRQHLAPRGVAMVWFNEYYVIPKTLAAAFTDMKCFYFFCLASPAPMARNDARRESVWGGMTPAMRGRVQERLSQPYYDKGGRAEALRDGANFPVNRDLAPITEYYVGYVIKSLRHRF